ncbi:hypothetical protein ABFX02_12G112900 [Erythranthe guttata]|uniref:uncharacterized protein LOC105967476 n=1 Tax=Erythranthe guttata TaxID=4155 RepID=UPI00064DCACB|nr:PREDICTED: uncharacterized protein LOC105967476 [Erythranthe guttata]|eukprot:XP_012847528.1 PREDICTED: uncharacterized protein LOC105967476 [Erythranthe guttata]
MNKISWGRIYNISYFEREIDLRIHSINTQDLAPEKKKVQRENKMIDSIGPPLIPPLVFFLLLFTSAQVSLSELTAMKGRSLMGIKETPNGGNVTFDCSPSGPCIPCARSEKRDEKYHCGETGYRIRLKCVPSGSDSKDAKSSKAQEKRSTLESDEQITSSSRQRRLKSDSSKSKGSYATYRSCIPAVNEEKLSVLGFEAIMLALLVSSGSFIYVRRKRSSAAAGGAPVRLPTNPRF